jgi:hypothetical protein
MDAAEFRESLVFFLAAGAALVLVFLFVVYSTVGT